HYSKAFGSENKNISGVSSNCQRARARFGANILVVGSAGPPLVRLFVLYDLGVCRVAIDRSALLAVSGDQWAVTGERQKRKYRAGEAASKQAGDGCSTYSKLIHRAGARISPQLLLATSVRGASIEALLACQT
ncbi:MAG: hypothetical protein ACRD3S_07780, partial [Terracidiphilus sp.]